MSGRPSDHVAVLRILRQESFLRDHHDAPKECAALDAAIAALDPVTPAKKLADPVALLQAYDDAVMALVSDEETGWDEGRCRAEYQRRIDRLQNLLLRRLGLVTPAGGNLTTELLAADREFDRAYYAMFQTRGLKEEIAAAKSFDTAKKRRAAALAAFPKDPA